MQYILLEAKNRSLFSHNRIRISQVTGQPAVNINYEANGNIQNKSDLGTYVYSPTAPNAVEKIWCGNAPYLPQQDITNTPFNKTEKITQGDYELTYTYGPDNQRRKSELKNLSTGFVEKTIIYSGSYEKITIGADVYEVHYITGGSGLTAINVIPPSGGQGALYYVYTDHLGSILTLTDENGTVVYEQNFDAWGRERNPNDWTYTANPNTKPEWLIRGFTGHEHLNTFALINMNGRVYDPLLGRFNSPDNYVQDPYVTQMFNRYSYAFNNPLLYTDPTGEQGWEGLWEDPWRDPNNFDYNYEMFKLEQMQWRNLSFAPLFLGGSANNPFLSSIHDDPFGADASSTRWEIRESYTNFGLTAEEYAELTKTGSGRIIYDPSNEMVFQGYYWVEAQGGGDASYWDVFKLLWNTRVIGRQIPDNISVDLNLGSVLGAGASVTWTANLMTRGKEPGLTFTRTEQMRKGAEVDWGINLNFGYYQGDPLEITKVSLLGPVTSHSAGIIAVGGSTFTGYSPYGVRTWRGASIGLGLTAGYSYGTGTTVRFTDW
ncbi:MAG: hypothetical protein HYY40_10735 [Bacteroidetes bacterium]|nr:hypothetical protein [Bacteroidota bacterium]